jgi:nitrate/nitrite-specific signal transduction histidine kinase
MMLLSSMLRLRARRVTSIQSSVMTSIGLRPARCANAFHPAQARRIEVEIQYDKSHLRLQVRDDGNGLDSEVFTEVRSGHWGLQGMRERAKVQGAIGSLE